MGQNFIWDFQYINTFRILSSLLYLFSCGIIEDEKLHVWELLIFIYVKNNKLNCGLVISFMFTVPKITGGFSCSSLSVRIRPSELTGVCDPVTHPTHGARCPSSARQTGSDCPPDGCDWVMSAQSDWGDAEATESSNFRKSASSWPSDGEVALLFSVLSERD